jgi:transposase InsO family protein
MDAMPAFDQLQLRFVDHIQWRYEVIRPLVLFEDRTATQRTAETHTHPETVRKLARRFEHQGMLGLFPEHTEVTRARPGPPIPAIVVEELTRLKALYQGFGYRELARILHYTCNEHIDDKTVKKLWHQIPLPIQGELPFGLSPRQSDRSQTRRQVIHLYAQGWSKRSISAFLHVSRPTVTLWIRRFEAEHWSGLEDKSRAPTAPVRKVWLPLMIEVYHLQKRHPDAGRFRIWSLLDREDISVRTVGRVMALNKQVYQDIPHVARQRQKKPPQPHPYKASYPHQYWFIDGRQMDFALDGVKWWSLILLDGYSRAMLAGAVAPSEASWVTLMVLYTACLRYGAPDYLISDSGGAFTSHEVQAVLKRLQIAPNPIVSTQGESYKNLMETHFNVQRRLYDYQFSLAQTPAELEQAHQAFLQIYNTTAHEGLLKEGFQPPVPLQVLGEAKGRLYTLEELSRRFSRAVFPRTTNQYGCVTLHSYHFYVEAGLPQTRVLLWVYGEQLRAVLDHVVLAAYQCRYDWRTQKVIDIRDGVFYPTRFASLQGALIPVTPHDSLVLYRPKAPGRRGHRSVPTQQLWLFALIHTA